MNNKCLYFHINPVKNEVFYIGIGSKIRAYSKHNRNNWWKNTVNKYGYEVQIIKDNITLEQANIAEMYWIKVFGRRDLNEGTLVNLTDGGNGIEGTKNPKSEEWRKKVSEANSGERNGNYGKKPWNFGKKFPNSPKHGPMSEEHKQKLREANLGKKDSEETKKKKSGRIPWNKKKKNKTNTI